MNSRGRKTPWEFAAFDLDFGPALDLAMDRCAGRKFCRTMKIDFTETVDSSTDGRVRKVDRDPSEHRHKGIDKYDDCARRSFQVLLIQQRILAFLLTCARIVLHDFSEDRLFNDPLQEEPPVSQIFLNKQTEYTSFTDVLSMAPYRGWNSMNFVQMRGYIQNALDTQKYHV